MTFKELYFCNDRWDGESLLTADIYPLNKEEKRQKRLIIGIQERLGNFKRSLNINNLFILCSHLHDILKS